MNQVDRLLINLKIIASVEPYQKLNTKSGHQLVIESGYTTTALFRWFRDDTRHNTVKRISEILEEASNIMTMNSSDNSSLINLSTSPTLYAHHLHRSVRRNVHHALLITDEYRSRILTQLKGTRVGMQNLRTTYESDPSITAHFDVLLERVDAILEKARRLNHHHQQQQQHHQQQQQLRRPSPGTSSVNSSDSSSGGNEAGDEEGDEAGDEASSEQHDPDVD